MTTPTFDEDKAAKTFEMELLNKPELTEPLVLENPEQSPLLTKENTSENGIATSIVNLLKRTSRKTYDSITTTLTLIGLFAGVIYITDKYFQSFISYWTMFAVMMAVFIIAIMISIIGRRLSKKDEPK